MILRECDSDQVKLTLALSRVTKLVQRVIPNPLENSSVVFIHAIGYFWILVSGSFGNCGERVGSL